MTDWCDWCIDSGGFRYDWLMWLMYRPSNLHSSPKCWHGISNINIYFNCHMLPTLLASYFQYKCSLFNTVPDGHTETLLLTFIPQMLVWYIQYQHIFSTGTCSQNCWQHISNTTMYSYKCSLPNHVPDGHTETPLTYIHPPNVCMVYPISTYIFNCHMLPKLLAAYIQYNYIFL